MELRQQVINEMRTVFADDQRRINHALKVLGFAERIAMGEGVNHVDLKIIILTAVLHDIGIVEAERKYHSNSGKYQEIEGPPIARNILKDFDIPEDMIERVCYIIGGHHTASKNNGIDFQIIWEADLLVNMEEEDFANKEIDLKGIIDTNFKTFSGNKIARDLYLKE